MRTLDRSLKLRLSQAERDANDPNLPESVRTSQASNASSLRNFIAQMGVPEKMDISVLSSPEAVSEIDKEELKIFIKETDESELDQLPQEVVDAILGKING